MALLIRTKIPISEGMSRCVLSIMILTLAGAEVFAQTRIRESMDCGTGALSRIVTELASRIRPRKAYSIEDMTLGMEFEGLVPVDVSYEQVAHRIAFLLRERLDSSELDTLRVFESSEAHSIDEWFVEYEWRGHTYRWRVGLDWSLDSFKKSVGIEIASPILRGAEDQEVFISTLKRLEADLGLRSYPLKGGIHYHVGFPEASVPEVALIERVMGEIEQELFEATSITPRRMQQHARPVLGSSLDTVGLALSGFEDWKDALRRLEWIVKHKKSSLNVLATTTYGTVEARFLNSTLNEGALRWFGDFMKHLVLAVRKKDPRLIAYLERSNEITVVALARTIGVPSEPYAQACEALHKEYARAVEKAGGASFKKLKNLLQTQAEVRGIYKKTEWGRIEQSVRSFRRKMGAQSLAVILLMGSDIRENIMGCCEK